VIDAVVLGRVGVDLYPNELETPLAEVKTFTRFVGGFAGNVATGLARLGVRCAIVSRVGAEGNGDFVRAWHSRPSHSPTSPVGPDCSATRWIDAALPAACSTAFDGTTTSHRCRVVENSRDK